MTWFITVQSNLNSSNTDGSSTMANSNSVLSHYEVLPIAQEKKYLEKFSYFFFFIKLYARIRIASLIQETAIKLRTHNVVYDTGTLT